MLKGDEHFEYNLYIVCINKGYDIDDGGDGND